MLTLNSGLVKLSTVKVNTYYYRNKLVLFFKNNNVTVEKKYKKKNYLEFQIVKNVNPKEAPQILFALTIVIERMPQKIFTVSWNSRIKKIMEEGITQQKSHQPIMDSLSRF